MKAITTIITLTPKATPITESREKNEILFCDGNNCFQAKYKGQANLMAI
jgi:hypothetical protein